MILKIDNNRDEIATEIHSIFQASYIVEAEMLRAINFPPLRRTRLQFIDSDSTFYAYYLQKNIAGLIEVRDNQDTTHIQSLVVYPKYFRQGIAKKLILFVLETSKSLVLIVETGVDNLPAITLYLSLGFVEQGQWNTSHGIRKVRFKKLF